MSKNALKLLVIFLAVSAAAAAAAAENYHLVKISGYDNETEYRLLTDSELSAFNEELREESKGFTRALMAAKKEWEKDESKGRTRYPRLSKRSLRVTKVYSEKDEAIEKLNSYASDEESKPKNRGKNAPVDKKAERAAKKAALENEAVSLLTKHLGALSKSNVSTSLPGIAPAAEKKVNLSKAKVLGTKDFKFSLTGTMRKTVGTDSYYIVPDQGTKIIELEPWALDIGGDKGKFKGGAEKFNIDETWVNKKVKVSGVADLKPKGNQVKLHLTATESLTKIEQ